MAEKKRLETTLSLEKQTKNTYRFREDPERPPIFNYIYLQKWAFGSNPPRRIKVIVEVLE